MDFWEDHFLDTERGIMPACMILLNQSLQVSCLIFRFRCQRKSMCRRRLLWITSLIGAASTIKALKLGGCSTLAEVEIGRSRPRSEIGTYRQTKMGESFGWPPP